MSGQDDDLLARLNALKPSSIGLNSATKAPSIDIEVSRPLSTEDRLAERLKGLRSGATSSGRAAGSGDETPDSFTAQIRDEITVEKDPIKNWQHTEDDEKALNELLADISPDDQWKLDPDDPENIDSLLSEAKAALSPQGDLENSIGENCKEEKATHDPRFDRKEGEEGQNETEDQQDEGQADDYVKRVLAELEVEKKYGSDDHDQAEAEERQSSSALDLPSFPSNLPSPPKSTQPPLYEDSELEARFSKLGLDLPETPNTVPSSKAKATSLGKSKAKPNPPNYTDEDIDSWCCICNEDAEVKCLGCDGDIYCQNCWRDGHGNGPGQERGHRAVQYNRKGPAAAAA